MVKKLLRLYKQLVCPGNPQLALARTEMPELSNAGKMALDIRGVSAAIKNKPSTEEPEPPVEEDGSEVVEDEGGELDKEEGGETTEEEAGEATEEAGEATEEEGGEETEEEGGEETEEEGGEATEEGGEEDRRRGARMTYVHRLCAMIKTHALQILAATV